MKKLFIWSVVIGIIAIASCRKKEIRDVGTIENAGAKHCSNGEFDEDELGLDCGGIDCDSCSQVYPSCSLDSNEIYYLESSITVTDDFINQTYIVSSGNYIFKAYTADGDSIIFTFSGKPDITHSYTGVAYSTEVDESHVLVEYFQPYPLKDYIGTGVVNVNFNNGLYTISSCDYSFQEWGSSPPPITQYFSVSF